MSLHQFLVVLRSRWRIAAAIFLAIVAAGLAAALGLPKRYTATTTLVIDVKSPDPVSERLLDAMVMPSYMATQRDIITSERVALDVVKRLGLDTRPQTRERWLRETGGDGDYVSWVADELQRGLQVKPPLESNVIRITYRSSDPAFAAAAANAFAQGYIESSIDLRVDPAKRSALLFDQQDDAARERLQRAQARLTEYQQKHGVVASEGRLDSETTKLNDLSAQLTAVQGQAVEANSKLRAAAAHTLPEVVGNPLIAALKADIARQEGKLGDLAGSLGANHPQYRRLESELAALRQRLREETRVIVNGFATAAAVNKKREADLAAAIAAQKERVLALRKTRDELAGLQREVDLAQKTYEMVSQRRMQSRLESQFTQTNFSVLNAANAPAAPSFPNLPVTLGLAIVLGAFCGIAAAFLLEMLDRRIRSADDVAEMLQMPVLGAVPRRVQPARLALPRKRSPSLPASL